MQQHLTWPWDSLDADQDHWVSEFTVVHPHSPVDWVHCLFHKSMHFLNTSVGMSGRQVLEKLPSQVLCDDSLHSHLTVNLVHTF